MTLFDQLEQRGLIAQTTHMEKIKDILNNRKITFYIGFDPTADSLHVGHFLQLIVMSHMQKAGHRPIAVLGGGTAMIGDPTGKTDMRRIMTEEEIDHNAECFKRQMSGLIDFSDGKAIMINNKDWLLELKYINFLREIGIHFSVNKMLTAECFKSRLERGLSFIEFNYMLMQSYDFLKLYEDYGCILQLGGDDQWSNIISGVDLIRRVKGKEAYGMTFTLLTTSSGAKMGKTEKGAVWLDPDKTSPYEFFQYWRNIDDNDVIRCFKLLTFIPVEEIEQIPFSDSDDINRAKERLAFEITKLVHGEKQAQEALDTARAIFVQGRTVDSMPAAEISEKDFEDNKIGLLDLLVKADILPSKAEARRLIQQGGLYIDDQKQSDPTGLVDKSEFDKGYIVIRKGKKNYYRVALKQ